MRVDGNKTLVFYIYDRERERENGDQIVEFLHNGFVTAMHELRGWRNYSINKGEQESENGEQGWESDEEQRSDFGLILDFEEKISPDMKQCNVYKCYTFRVADISNFRFN